VTSSWHLVRFLGLFFLFLRAHEENDDAVTNESKSQRFPRFVRSKSNKFHGSGLFGLDIPSRSEYATERNRGSMKTI